MIGIILAAGKGTRLQPLTYAIPKPLLPVGGKPVIEYVIDNLKRCKDITKIYIAVSHMRDALENYFSHVDYGIEIELVRTLGWETGGDLKTILSEKNIKEPVVVAYGDIIAPMDVSELVSSHKRLGRKATIGLFNVPKEDVHRFGIAEVDKEMRITSFVEKPKNAVASTSANSGYYILNPDSFDQLDLKRVKTEESLFPKLVKERQLSAHMCKLAFWLDIGTIESYRKANKMMEGILPPENGK